MCTYWWPRRGVNYAHRGGGGGAMSFSIQCTQRARPWCGNGCKQVASLNGAHVFIVRLSGVQYVLLC